ncbi:MAG TPA: bifunctional (p)ppGpp synthetase/guanosine-3',5'-bis(diphosphate) 3'-pyrophosphohydrolase, partial [Candidatus Moranbacteria bacterium]|nr:bifunctional (p)ppGpp synthetase/guanosine-3',5'-bis(diphosphate) 3'-pyrophosphohydrolase [Candidatus Moranbacteria bacterium]
MNKPTEEKLLTLNDVLAATRVSPDAAARKLLSRAFAFAEEAHRGQKRKSGVPYIQHCLATAAILAGQGMDPETVAAGILHDVPEDTDRTLEDVRAEFGPEVAAMVDGVTKLGHIRLKGSHEEIFVENLRKMFLAMAADIRVVIVKLCDRLHNMRTLSFVPPEKQQRIARETMEVYAQIANRLGMSEIKSELEDLAFRYLQPEEFA